MSQPLARLLRPSSIALFGGSWAANVLVQLQKSGYAGRIWPVHPRREELLGVRCYRAIDELPGAPDASFIGVNREDTIALVGLLAQRGAGGAVCFASGFRESEQEFAGGADLQAQLVRAAADMPILGPNCYGLINYLDNVCLWPDQHGGRACARGVALVTQSSNIAINLTMQRRGLPLAYVVTAGNQAQTDIGAIASELLRDERVTAVGLHIEGFGSLRGFERMAALARSLGKPVIALKCGRSQKAREATMTHTASLAGDAVASSAILRHLGIAEVDSVEVLLETLKLLHQLGPLPGRRLCSVSCSGGEAALAGDTAESLAVEFPSFGDQHAALAAVLGPRVTIANPLDFHTYIWGDRAKMTACFAAVMREGFDLSLFVLDIPRADRCDPAAWECSIDSIIAARNATGARVAVVSLLAENLDEQTIERFATHGIASLCGLSVALQACEAAANAGEYLAAYRDGVAPLLLAPEPVHDGVGGDRVLGEAEAKMALARFGVPVPRAEIVERIEDLAAAAVRIGYPCVLKGIGPAHKTEAGAVAIGLKDAAEVAQAADRMRAVSTAFLLEQMIEGAVAELLVGVRRDASGAFVLTLGFGGILTELIRDTVTVALPVSRAGIATALRSLKVGRLIAGYRGGPAGNENAVLDVVEAIARFAAANSDRLLELDVNPVLVKAADAIAVDALIREIWGRV